MGDKPVFTAVAALDDRQPKWTALLDVPSNEAGDIVALRKLLAEADQQSVISIGGYGVPGDLRTAMLWRAVRQSWAVGAAEPLARSKRELAEAVKEGMVVRVHRPYPVGENVLTSDYVETAAENSPFASELSAAEVPAFADKARADGGRVASIAGYVVNGVPAFAVVSRANPGKAEWSTDIGLATTKLADAIGEKAKAGFRPDSVTAYAWDGAVRYCVVWVKEAKKDPPKEEKKK